MRSLAFVAALGAGLAGAPALANEAFLAAEGVRVTAAKGALPEGPLDAAWQKVPAATIVAAAQRTVLLMDKDANAYRQAKPIMVEARALTDGERLAVHLSWADSTHDRIRFGGTHAFGDSVAIEMPLEFGAGKRLPYVGMGDPEAHVLISMMRAIVANELGKKDLRKGTYVGAGFGSLTRADLDWLKMDMQYSEADKGWRAVFVRPWSTADHDIARPLVPFAIAIWDGSKHQRGGNKFLSRWRVLVSPDKKAEPEYMEELAYGYNPGEVGNAAVGKALAGAVCSACHRFADKNTAPPQLAPELSNIGVISNYAYLRDSISKPNEIIVPVLNLNRHYSKSAPTDRYGAHPNDMTYQWFTPGPDGTRTSRMPPFVFPPAQVADIIAYLKTLGAPEEEVARR